MPVPVVDLNDGYKMPFFGFGTYSLNGQRGEDAIKYAIDIGYRHIDTAFLYENENEVGNAIRAKIEDGTVERGDLFITTKLDSKFMEEDEVMSACVRSLKNLGLDFVDLYLIHCPVSLKEPSDQSCNGLVPSEIDYVTTWRGMEKCKQLGFARSIGVSNFNSEQLTRLISTASDKPVNNQIEVSLNLNQRNLIEYCNSQDITVTGFSPLGKPGKRPDIKNAWLDPKVQELSEKYGKTPAQISLRFVLQMGAAPIPKSATKSRIKENIEIFDFRLTAEEMIDLMKIETGERVVPLDVYKDAKYFPFNVPF